MHLAQETALPRKHLLASGLEDSQFCFPSSIRCYNDPLVTQLNTSHFSDEETEGLVGNHPPPMVTPQANSYLGKGKRCESTPKNQGTSWVLPALAENQMPLRQSELKAQRRPWEAPGKPSKTLMLLRKQGLEQGLSPAQQP